MTHLPRGSALARAELGEDAEWGLAEQLQAAAVDALHAANWQRSGKGKLPRPIPRPGVKSNKTTVGHAIRNPVTTKAFLDQFKPPLGEDADPDDD